MRMGVIIGFFVVCVWFWGTAVGSSEEELVEFLTSGRVGGTQAKIRVVDVIIDFPERVKPGDWLTGQVTLITNPPRRNPRRVIAFEGNTTLWSSGQLTLSRVRVLNRETKIRYEYAFRSRAPRVVGKHKLQWRFASAATFPAQLDPERLVGFAEVTCSDGIFCNGAERYINGRCVRGTPPCNDDVACTTDVCNEQDQTCRFELDPSDPYCRSCSSNVQCTPQPCGSRQCGSDGCFGSCGTCSAGNLCVEGRCRTPSEQGTCLRPIPLVEDGAKLVGMHVVTGTTTDGYNIEYPSCISSTSLGAKEKVYTFEVTDYEVGMDARSYGFDTVLSLRRDDCGSDAASPQSTCSDDATPPGGTGSRISLILSPGRYYLIVDGYGTAEGNFTLSVNFVEGCLPDCNLRSCGIDNCGGSCGQCDETEICTRDGSCIVDTSCRALQCEARGLGCIEGTGVCADLSARGTCNNPINLVPGNSPIRGLYTVLGTTENGQSIMTSSCGGSGREKVYTFLVSTAGIQMDARVSGYDTVLYLRRRNCSSTAAGSQVGCSDNNSPPGLGGSRIQETLRPGRHYLVVDGFSTNGYGRFNLTVNFGSCLPDCDLRQCGDDGCGGVCGTCAESEFCTSNGQCDVDTTCGGRCEPRGLFCVAGRCTNITDIGTCNNPISLLGEGEMLSGVHVVTGTTVDGYRLLTGTCGGNGNEKVLRFEVTTPTAMEAVSTGFDTVLYLRKGSCTQANQPDNYCNDDSTPPGSLGSRLAIPRLTQGTYYLVMDTYSESPGEFRLTVNFPPNGCLTSCGSATCGPDGCGGVCGTCRESEVCTEGYCTAPCVPNCRRNGRECGSDGCGGTCGDCSDERVCRESTGQCVPRDNCNHLVPRCTGCRRSQYCGSDCKCYNARSKLPDFVVGVETLQDGISFATQTFSASSCAIDEGCVSGTGPRKLLKFPVEVINQGRKDIYFGDPDQSPDLFEYSACHGHYHFKSFANYTLYDSSGRVALVGLKYSFCIINIRQALVGPSIECDPVRSCSDQGLKVGWSDIYDSNLDCQWLDVTDLPAGDYILEIELNAARFFHEESFENNKARVPVRLPRVFP